MARETHTPTPWTLDGGYLSGPNGEPIAVLGPASMLAGSIMERDANGRLVVAAVNERAALREALRTLVQHHDGGVVVTLGERMGAWEAARDALALGKDAESRKEGR